MATAILDITINEGDSFIMALDFWSDVDNTIPIDITADTFNGSFKIGTKVIPMTITTSTIVVNSIECKIVGNLLKDLSNLGKYDIDQVDVVGDTFRLMQGALRISQEVTI